MLWLFRFMSLCTAIETIEVAASGVRRVLQYFKIETRINFDLASTLPLILSCRETLKAHSGRKRDFTPPPHGEASTRRETRQGELRSKRKQWVSSTQKATPLDKYVEWKKLSMANGMIRCDRSPNIEGRTNLETHHGDSLTRGTTGYAKMKPA